MRPWRGVSDARVAKSAKDMAEQLRQGRVITLELREDRARQARDFFERAGVADRVELIEGDATLQALLVRTAGETGARTRDLLCAEGYHVTRKNVLNYRRTRKCARDAQAQREPERVSQP